MKNSYLLHILLFTGLMLTAVSCHGNNGSAADENTGATKTAPHEREALLSSIDTLIRTKKSAEQKRRKRISRIKTERRNAVGDTSAYRLSLDLYNAYSGFRLDSAFYAATDRLEIARRLGDPAKIAEATVLKAQSIMNLGENVLAINLLDGIDRKMVTEDLGAQMNSIYFGAYSSLSKTIPSADMSMRYRSKAESYRDSIIAFLPPNSVGHIYLTAQKLHDQGDLKSALALISHYADGREFRDNAAFQCGAGVFYMESGDKEKAIDMLARAADLDLNRGKKEYMSLIILASLLYDEGDIERSFQYLKCALEDASYSHATLRAQEIFEILPVIDGAYNTYRQMENDRIRRNVKISVGITVFLLLTIAALWLQFRRISRMKRLLAESNTELQKKTEWLEEMDKAKIHHIESLLKLHSTNISNTKKYRRNLYRLVKGGQYDKVADRLKSDTMDNSEVKLFYGIFDSTFKAIYPDFIVEINKYLKQPYQEQHPEAFTPEQRIMALMKFGYTSVADISGMLQYTTQTVYNYRSSIRRMLNCTWEEFIADVYAVQPDEEEDEVKPEKD